MDDLRYNVFLKKARLAYTDRGVAKNLFSLPKGAIALRFLVAVSAAFDDSGADVLDLGKAGDADYFANDVDLAAADEVIVEQKLGPLAADTVVTGTYTGQNSDATAGAAEVYVLFAHWTEK